MRRRNVRKSVKLYKRFVRLRKLEEELETSLIGILIFTRSFIIFVLTRQSQFLKYPNSF